MTWMTLKRLSATAAALLVCALAFDAAAHETLKLDAPKQLNLPH